MHLVVCSVRRPEQLEGTEQTLGAEKQKCFERTQRIKEFATT